LPLRRTVNWRGLQDTTREAREILDKGCALFPSAVRVRETSRTVPPATADLQYFSRGRGLSS